MLISGDLTHVGLPDEFRQAQRWLESLGKPEDIAVIPGNHDALVATPWQDTLALWEGYLASDTDSEDIWPSVRVRGDLVFIGLFIAVLYAIVGPLAVWSRYITPRFQASRNGVNGCVMPVNWPGSFENTVPSWCCTVTDTGRAGTAWPPTVAIYR